MSRPYAVQERIPRTAILCPTGSTRCLPHRRHRCQKRACAQRRTRHPRLAPTAVRGASKWEGLIRCAKTGVTMGREATARGPLPASRPRRLAGEAEGETRTSDPTAEAVPITRHDESASLRPPSSGRVWTDKTRSPPAPGCCRSPPRRPTTAALPAARTPPPASRRSATLPSPTLCKTRRCNSW